MCDSNLSCVLMLNNNVIGVFNSIERLNNYVSGCVQNKFFTKEMISIKTFVVNSCLGVSLPVNKPQASKPQASKPQASKQQVNNLQVSKPLKTNVKKLENPQSLSPIERTELTHKNNVLKNDKKKMENELNIYNTEVEIYKQFKDKKKKDDTFMIPEMFRVKYKLYSELDNKNKLNFDDYHKKWSEIKPPSSCNIFDTIPHDNMDDEDISGVEYDYTGHYNPVPNTDKQPDSMHFFKKVLSLFK